MLKFKNILSLPSYLKDRIDKVKILTPNITNIKKEDNSIIISGVTNRHNQTIIFLDKEITYNTYVKVDCDCESFRFEFAYIINDSLINPRSYPKVPPKNKNPKGVKGVCKHIIALANLIDKKKTSILRK